MSFSTTEQLSVLNLGNPSPEISCFKDLVYQIAIDIVTKRAGEEIPFLVDAEGNISLDSPLDAIDLDKAGFDNSKLSKAMKYQDKMKSFSQKVIFGNDNVKQQLQRATISFMAQDQYPFALVENANDKGVFDDNGNLVQPGWEQLILAQIVSVFELLATTEPGEPECFKALVAIITQ